MSVLYLTEQDVGDLLTMPLALAAVEQAFTKLALGEADNVPRDRCKAPGAVHHAMSAAAGYLGIVGWKNYTTTRAGAKFLVGFSSAATGELLALIEADRLGQIRTGAASGIAIRHLTAANTDRLALFGTGWQAAAQLRAACHVRPIFNALVYSRSAEKREAFAAQMTASLSAELNRQIVVRAVASADEAIHEMPIVITATSSGQPVFNATALSENAIVCAMGSNWPQRAEAPAEVVARSAVVCDQIIACQKEAGDLLLAESAGQFTWDRAIELADVVAGKVPAPRGPVLFKSVGLAIEDLAVGHVLLAQAKQHGRGIELPI